MKQSLLLILIIFLFFLSIFHKLTFKINLFPTKKRKWLWPGKVLFIDGKVVFVRRGNVFVRVSPNRPWRVKFEEGMNIVDSDTQKKLMRKLY